MFSEETSISATPSLSGCGDGSVTDVETVEGVADNVDSGGWSGTDIQRKLKV
jgi:hypothetical protein